MYFDHTASGLVSDDILAFYSDALKEYNYNPASLHRDGREAKYAIQEACERIASCLDCKAEEIVVTSGASESINTAIAHTVRASHRRGGRLLSFEGEHAATRESMRAWAELMSRPCLFLPETAEGKSDLQALVKALQEENTALVSSMWVNNENGAINDPAAIAALTRKYAPTARIHIDAVQALGKIPLSFRESEADFMSFSLHKIGVPKGIGFLLRKRNIPLQPLIYGGGQQQGKRSGTENAPLVVTAAYALERMNKEMDERTASVIKLHRLFLEQLRKEEISFRLLSPEDAVPHILSLYFPGLRAESLQTALSAEGMDVSIGSACSSAKSSANPALLALGLNAEAARHIIRVSFAATNTEEECVCLATAISSVLKKYARFPS